MSKMVFEFSRSELAVRLFTALNGMAPPDGLTPKEAIAQMPADIAQDVVLLATTAIIYFREVIRDSKEMQ